MWHEIVYSEQAGVDGIASHVYNLGVFFSKNSFCRNECALFVFLPTCCAMGAAGRRRVALKCPVFLDSMSSAEGPMDVVLFLQISASHPAFQLCLHCCYL